MEWLRSQDRASGIGDRFAGGVGERKRGIAHFINSEFPLHIYLSFWVSHSGPSTRARSLPSLFGVRLDPSPLPSFLRPFFLYKTAIALISFNVRRRRRHSDPYALPEKSISCAGGVETGERGSERGAEKGEGEEGVKK